MHNQFIFLSKSRYRGMSIIDLPQVALLLLLLLLHLLPLLLLLLECGLLQTVADQL
jgi:hypothetical protein